MKKSRGNRVTKTPDLLSQSTAIGYAHLDLCQQSLRSKVGLHEVAKLLFCLQFVVIRAELTRESLNQHFQDSGMNTTFRNLATSIFVPHSSPGQRKTRTCVGSVFYLSNFKDFYLAFFRRQINIITLCVHSRLRKLQTTYEITWNLASSPSTTDHTHS